MSNSKGSLWFRWEPHIHCPGTILNDQFSGADPMEDFVKRIENSSPVIRALGITDYYSIAAYEQASDLKLLGRMPNIDFLFPNIELRFNTGTSSGSAINGHLLISPDDPNHVAEAKRFLTNLTFSVGSETYRCNREDLIRLGYFHDKTISTDDKALEVGTNQFKVDHTQLIDSYNKSDWAKRNIIIAVSANSNDGTSGLQKDASFSALRKKIERTAHIMLTSHENQRLFWLGKGVLSKEKIIEEYDSLKPCIHGSDAHENSKVGNPDLNRYTWIKGDLTFESLRQICIEPEERVFIGESPEDEKIASTVIDTVEIQNAQWLKNPTLELNPGLIAIIGARGSGKTALADLIALGGYAISAQLNSKTSFIERAKDYISGVSTTLSWKSGEKTNNSVSMIGLEDLFDSSRVQYLSQQFVDTLCSAEGITDELMQEIERVIFTAHPENSRIGIMGFREMLKVRSSTARRERQNYEQQIGEISEAITHERGKKNSISALNKKLEEKSKVIETDKNNQKALIITGTNEKIDSLEKVSSALTAVSGRLDKLQKQQQSIKALQQAVSMARASTFPNYLKKLKTEYKESALDEKQWESFNVNFTGDTDTLLLVEEKRVAQAILKLIGSDIQNPVYKADSSFINSTQQLNEHTYYKLHHETERLKVIIGLDTQKGKQYAQLNSKIIKEEQELEKLKGDIQDATGADERIKKLIANRRDAYQKVFAAIIDEEKTLKDLYKPLEENLKTQKGSLSKLAFHVKRFVDIDTWAAEGENLLDLRKGGALRGRGSLAAASNELKLSWEKGTAQEISDAMTKFRNEQEANFVEHSPYERSDPEFNKWANRVAEWLYSTKHVTLSYGIKYDSVDIGQLSPGTRGIVLLLLYLAIDKEDIRPLIIDQPEENLDPKSIFDELVPLFRIVKLRRQIIIVTHNANLVVNTDADQVIIAECGQHTPGRLPDIHYLSGGLENPAIRSHVCSILEGGEAAFKERAKRLRVTL